MPMSLKVLETSRPHIVEEEIPQPDVKRLFSSGYTADLMHVRGLTNERLEFIMKPVQPVELLRKVREMLDR